MICECVLVATLPLPSPPPAAVAAAAADGPPITSPARKLFLAISSHLHPPNAVIAG